MSRLLIYEIKEVFSSLMSPKTLFHFLRFSKKHFQFVNEAVASPPSLGAFVPPFFEIRIEEEL